MIEILPEVQPLPVLWNYKLEDPSDDVATSHCPCSSAHRCLPEATLSSESYTPSPEMTHWQPSLEALPDTAGSSVCHCATAWSLARRHGSQP